MPAQKSLRVVAPDESAAPVHLTVAQAAATGSHKSLLVAMRERIATTVSSPDCPPRDLAALTRRLQDIAKELEAINHAEKQEAQRAGSRASAGSDAFDAAAV